MGSVHHLPLTPDSRLRLALRSLDEAIEAQRQSVAGLRAAYDALTPTHEPAALPAAVQAEPEAPPPTRRRGRRLPPPQQDCTPAP